MFCFRADVFLTELAMYAPDIYNTSKNAFDSRVVDENKAKIRLSDMQNIPDDSIDYAVMEKSALVKVVPCDNGVS